MNKYIDSEKLISAIDKILLIADKEEKLASLNKDDNGHLLVYTTKIAICEMIKRIAIALQWEQPDNMIQWTGDNLKEVIDFTGKSPRFEEWFKSWDEYENYVHTHNDILKLFCDDGSHYEVPVNAWIVKTPDGRNVPSISRFVNKQQNEIGGKKPFYDNLLHQWRIEYTTKDGGYCAILADTEEECVERYEYKKK